MLAPVAPVLHVTVPLQFVAVNVALSVPQTSVLLLVILGADGAVPPVITTLFEFPEVPHELLQVAVYVPAPTWILAPVTPVLHVTVPLQFIAVKVARSVPHSSVLLLEILGVVGRTPVLITIGSELVLDPHALLQVAV